MIIVQDTWNEEDDQELHEYLTDYIVMNSAQILQQPKYSIDVLFADTNLVQHFITDIFESYPEFFNGFYQRNIRKIDIKELPSIPFSYFCKPYSSNKTFPGLIVDCAETLETILDIQKEGSVYVCDKVNFVNEFRIFYDKDSILGEQVSGNAGRRVDCDIQDCTDYLHIYFNYIVEVNPPVEFIKLVMSKCQYKMCTIDIGMLDNGVWAIVEVNPPYALSSYGLPIDKYVAFCKKAWKTYL